MAEHLADAVHQLDLASTGCYYLAGGITRDLKEHTKQQQTEPVNITDRQADGLARLSIGAGTLSASLCGGSSKAVDSNRERLHLATLNSLTKQGLLRVDTTTPLVVGQLLEITDKGQTALAQHTPTRPATRAPSVPAPPHGIQRHTADDGLPLTPGTPARLRPRGHHPRCGPLTSP